VDNRIAASSSSVGAVVADIMIRGGGLTRQASPIALIAAGGLVRRLHDRTLAVVVVGARDTSDGGWP
jgi:hypothetical protein